jgi:hypothetical protein
MTWQAGPPKTAVLSHANMAPQPMSAPQQAPKPYQNVDFGSYTQRLSKIYNKYSSSSGSKEHDNAGDAITEI